MAKQWGVGTAIALGLCLPIAAAAVSARTPPPKSRTAKTLAEQSGLYIEGVSSSGERDALGRLAGEVDTLLTSAAFYENLETVVFGYSSVWLGSTRQSVTPAAFTETMKNKDRSHRYVPTPVALVGNGGNATALAGHSGATERVGNEDINQTYMSIGRRHLRRYLSTNSVERSCAVNTVAHERSHTYSSHARYANLVIEDVVAGAPKIGGPTPFASYLIGSVAQCTWLQQQRRIDKKDVGACVAAFGVSEYFDTRCDQFDTNEPVKWPKNPRRP
jgi:hypothetical protein